MAPVSRVSLSFQQKKDILREVELNSRSKTDIAKAFGIPKSTLSTIIKAKDKILNAGSTTGFAPARMRSREAKFPELESALLLWMRKIRGKNVPIDGKLLKKQAETYALRLKLEEFKCSDGWLQKFKSRHGLSFNKLSGESASANVEAANTWKEGQLKQLLAEYAPDDVFNADETGLMFKLLPDRTLSFKDEKCHGGKRSKERITIMLAANMSGTEKLPLLVIGKAQNPRCFKGVRNLPTVYKANSKAWMTAKIFEEWLQQLDRKFSAKGRKVLLILDNCTAHTQVNDLRAIRVEFLPPNVTSVLQPMDQGVIQAFKKHYRRMLLKRIILNLENDQEYVVTLLAAIHLACAAWNLVSEETVSNCFRHAGFAAVPGLVVRDDVTDPDDDALLDVLRSRNVNIPENTSFSDYASVDSDIVCIDEWTDEDILRQAVGPADPENSHSDGENDDAEDVVVPKPTSKEAAAAVSVLQKYFEDGSSNLSSMLTVLEGHIFKCADFRQAKITAFLSSSK